ncbi:MAG: GTP-binding protein [Clostridia bacterium]|nr:GTP-binding protein [Clostridia bacterium]
MTKIDIFSGFLGAGKTTLIKKLIGEVYAGEKVVLIENEFGEIGIDGGFLQDAGVNITEMNSGCICCSLVGDFSKALKEVTEKYSPERIIIEPSGVGKLSDVVLAVERANLHDAKVNALCAVVDATKCKMYMKNFGEFFNDQIRSATCIVMSHADKCAEDKLALAVSMVKAENPHATVVTTAWDKLSGGDILNAMENKDSLQAELEKLAHAHQHTHEHHHEHGEDCHCHHCEEERHHHEHEHHHHEHGEECHCHEHHHEHHHEHGEECHCHEHHHEHHHHHADEVFTSWGVESSRKFTKTEIKTALQALSDSQKYGTVLRAKGIVDALDADGKWIHFDYVPDEPDVRTGEAGVTGRLCVIGCQLNEQALKELFKV